ncbi:sodium:proton antiporter [Litorimonas sp. RW-G-Af-16]|uniref:sodium:proton antiporter n=1 Tax=Litorimonas sp. RW-G-Af-16 TaxID=3241168 RepID=UPI00390C70F3
MLSEFIADYNYVIVIVLMMTGLYVVFASRNLIKKLVGLSVFQTSLFLLYITIGKVKGGQPPILEYAKDKDYAGLAPETLVAAADGAAGAAKHSGYNLDIAYSNPLPHVLILTAIVVGVATLAIGLSLTVRIREVYNTIEEDEINEADYIYNLEGTAG